MLQQRWIVPLAAALAFVWLAFAVRGGGTLAFDAPLRAALSRFDAPLIIRLVRTVTLLGWDLVVIPLMAGVAWRLAAAGRRREAMMLAVVVLGMDAMVNLIKMAFARNRPEAQFGYHLPSTSSFPSGHAALSLAFFGTTALLVGGTATWIAAVLLIALVGLSRIYLGVHYASDVLAGYALSIVWISLVRWVFKRRH
jgi:undecaprenyl-diphosphatase